MTGCLVTSAAGAEPRPLLVHQQQHLHNRRRRLKTHDHATRACRLEGEATSSNQQCKVIPQTRSTCSRHRSAHNTLLAASGLVVVAAAVLAITRLRVASAAWMTSHRLLRRPSAPAWRQAMTHSMMSCSARHRSSPSLVDSQRPRTPRRRPQLPVRLLAQTSMKLMLLQLCVAQTWRSSSSARKKRRVRQTRTSRRSARLHVVGATRRPGRVWRLQCVRSWRVMLLLRRKLRSGMW